MKKLILILTFISALVAQNVTAQKFAGARHYPTKTALDLVVPNITTKNNAVLGLVINATESTFYVWTVGSSSWEPLSGGGGGTENYIPVFDANGDLIDSPIYKNGSNIGIGTTSAAYVLDVVGGFRSQGFFSMTNPTDNILMGAWGHNGNGNAIRYIGNSVNSASMTFADNTPTTQVNITTNGSTYFNGGNFGINTTNPDRKLTVFGAGSATPIIEANSGTKLASETAYLGAQGFSLFGYDGVRGAVVMSDAGTSKPLVFDAGGAEAMRINTNGSVGIGISSALSFELEVAGNGIASGNSFGYILGLSTETETGRWLNTSGINTLRGDGTRSWQVTSVTNGLNVKFDNFNNRVGLGIASPLHQFHIKSLDSKTPIYVENGTGFDAFKVVLNASGRGQIEVGDGAGSTKAYIYGNGEHHLFDTGGTLDVKLTPNGASYFNGGDVGINTITPSAKLTIVGNNDDQILITNSQVDDVIKFGGIGTNSYDVDEEPFLFMNAQTGAAYNRLEVGGGVGNGNVATEIRLKVGAINTLTGTTAMKVNTTGVSIGSHDPTVELDVVGDVLVTGDMVLTGFLDLPSTATVPTAVEGRIYMDDGTNTGGTPALRYYNGTVWIDL